MDGLKIEDLRVMCHNNNIKWTLHALKRIRKRNILADAVVDTILSGEIIEQYPKDKYFPSCLIFNNDCNTPLHVVVGTDKISVHIITAYSPTFDEWECDYKTRKENK